MSVMHRLSVPASAAALAWVAAWAVGCGSPAPVTELLVVVDSNLAVPAQIDSVRVEVSGVMTSSATGTLSGPGATALPRTVGLVHRGGPLGPVEVNVIGTLAGAEVVRARAITSFVEGKTLILPIMLARTCLGVTCGADRTCSGGDCLTASVDPATLDEWSGDVPRLDGGQCIPFDERCNDRDDDCDGRVDEGIDLQTDPTNCGSCGTTCARANAVVGCAAGACSVTGCDPGFGDCNAMADDGCEVDVTTSVDHCGACGTACAFANAAASCVASTCAIGACNAGFGDCDGDPANGCEVPLDTLTDCGACGVTCSVTGGTATCATGTCAVATCDAGLGDCDLDPATGCELTVDTLTDCGACGTACDLANATETCATLTCEIVACGAGFEDCNGMASDGCERSTTTLTDCGACGVACSITGGSATCATGTCEVGTCFADVGDCDSDPANGCETDLRRNDAHCGTCGNACPAGQTCRMSVCR